MQPLVLDQSILQNVSYILYSLAAVQFLKKYMYIIITFFIASLIINRSPMGRDGHINVTVPNTGWLKAHKARTSTVISLCLPPKLMYFD